MTPGVPGFLAPRADRVRSSPGASAKTSRTVSLNVRMDENPAAKATSAMGSAVVSIRTLAVWARWDLASANGPAPSSARSWRSTSAGGVAEPGSEPGDALPVDDPVLDEPHGTGHGVGAGVPLREPGLVSGRQRLQARKPACWQAAALG